MFYKGPDHVYRAQPLERFEWLLHGFGTRLSAPPGPPLATLRQIHSDVCVEARGRSGILGDGDALVESAPGCVVAVKTADCVPVLLVNEETRTVAAVHAGWRGAALGIAAKTAGRLGDPAQLYAAIGPAIGPCCYKVGPEVAAQFGREGTVFLDLIEENRSQLIAAGLAEERIYGARLCTRCLAEEFHSYRRDRQQAGRMFSFIGRKGAPETV